MKALALAGMALLTVGWPGASHAETPEESLRAGTAALEKGDPLAALIAFQACLDSGAAGKLREQALNWVAEAHWRGKDIEKAIKAFDVEIDTGTEERERTNALFRKAMALMAKGDEDAGQATYARLAREYPKGPETAAALMFQANYAIVKKGNRRQAIELFEDIVLRFPETDEGKHAYEILPGLRQVTETEFKRQVLEWQQGEAAAKKAKAAEAARENGGTK
jgi:outer membrane protein assembly factor BamD (BamD/ComL family)